MTPTIPTIFSIILLPSRSSIVQISSLHVHHLEPTTSFWRIRLEYILHNKFGNFGSFARK